MLLFIIFWVLPVSHGSYNFSDSVTPKPKPLVEASIAMIRQFFVPESNHIYIRRRASNPGSVFVQRDIVNELTARSEPHIKIQLETYQAKVLEQLRAFNVFLVDDYKAFERISDGMKVRTYNYNGFFMVIVSNSSESSGYTVQRIMDELWTHYIVNVAILISYEYAPEKTYYYTYFPFGNGYCERVQPTLWKVFSEGHFGNLEKEFFPPKLSNMHGCPLKLATFEIAPFVMLKYDSKGKVIQTDGLEGIVARVLSQQLNFTTQIVLVDPPDWGITAVLGSSTGASRYVRWIKLHVIRDREVNFSIGYWALTHSRSLYMGSTFPYYSSLMTIIAPPGYPYSTIEQLMLPFKYIIWCCITSILAIAFCVITIVNRRSISVQYFVFGRRVSAPLLNTFNVFFGGSLHRLPGRNFARTLIAAWLLYSLVIRTSYTASLFKFLKLQPNRTVPQIIPEYIAAGYHIRMTRNLSYMFDGIPDVLPHLHQTSYAQLIATGIDELQLPSTRYVMLMPIEAISFFNRNLTKQGKLLRTVYDRVFLSKLAIYTQKSAPFLPAFNTFLGRLNAAGFIDQWASKYHQPVFLKQIRWQTGPRPLELQQVMGCFILLLGGLIAGLLAFVLECFLEWRKRKVMLRRMRRLRRTRRRFVLYG
ncbi:glutamate receptor ionotropic, delta-2-like [Culex pipiens pallens]|uniref:glutamate receptor ionotropic, delta-2-like n=1 Tax=Culex pipiens pallens TaxID=42434 RepID=UPI001954F47E|nr:glutamate receptor ionotropic, delta-2-like [Culex pipiens pallens]